MARALPRDGTIARSCKTESRDSAFHVFAVIVHSLSLLGNASGGVALFASGIVLATGTPHGMGSVP
jgi:hypothetical protein